MCLTVQWRRAAGQISVSFISENGGHAWSLRMGERPWILGGNRRNASVPLVSSFSVQVHCHERKDREIALPKDPKMRAQEISSDQSIDGNQKGKTGKGTRRKMSLHFPTIVTTRCDTFRHSFQV